MKNNNIPKARKNGLVVQDLNGETLIYDLDTHRAVCLNETSALVWQNCDGTKTVSQLSEVLTNKLKNPANEDLIWLALDQLKKENLIENKEELETKFEGVSRREAIRNLGMSSLIALPIVASLVTPSAAQSASACAATTGRPNNCACTASSQCNSGCCGNGQGPTTNNQCSNFTNTNQCR